MAQTTGTGRRGGAVKRALAQELLRQWEGAGFIDPGWEISVWGTSVTFTVGGCPMEMSMQGFAGFVLGVQSAWKFGVPKAMKDPWEIVA